MLFLSNVIWPPQQRLNCGNLGPLQTWALLKLLLKASRGLELEMTNQKHIESGLVDYRFEDHSLQLSSLAGFVFFFLLLLFFLQVKIGILIAQPQFLIHDAQKGHGLLISSDYEHPELGPGCCLISFNSSLPEITVCKHMEV